MRGTMLLTGATGFVGGELLRRLARQDRPVVCLVRADSPAGAEQRGRDTLRRLSVPRDRWGGIRWVAGDVLYYVGLLSALLGAAVAVVAAGASLFFGARWAYAGWAAVAFSAGVVVFLAGATLSYSWRTVVAMGTWTSGLWALGVGWVYLQPLEQTELSNKIKQAVGDDHRLFELLDPHNIMFDQRIQEIVLFIIIATTLALGVRRANELVSRQAAASMATLDVGSPKSDSPSPNL